jgi:hypothetical protein
MAMTEIELRLDAHGPGATGSMGVRCDDDDRQVLSDLILVAAAGHPVMCLAVNATGAADAALALGERVRRNGEGFVLDHPDAAGFSLFLERLNAEEVLLTFGDSRQLDALGRAANPPWWKWVGKHTELVRPLLRYSQTHRSLEVQGDAGMVLSVFDRARERLALK